jgi:hypothetical protein
MALLTLVIGVVISPIHFYCEAIACGRMKEGGGGFSVSLYRSSYFVHVSFAHYSYASEEKATEAFGESVRDAIQVLDVGPKFNRRGEIVGRRAVVIARNPRTIYPLAVLFWTDGKVIHSVASTSLLHVMQFERQLDD